MPIETVTAPVIRPLREGDLTQADRIMRIAFGTFIGVPEPETFMGDAAFVQPRWTASPHSAFAAEFEGRIVGSNFATRWGSFGFFGPLTVDPACWDRGIAGRLMAPVMRCFDEWGVTHAGLFTFAQSPKHIGLYQKFGFRPRALTMVMARDSAGQATDASEITLYSALDEAARREALDACRAITEAIYPGLDVTSEIEAIASQRLGDTVLISDTRGIMAFAACHAGAGSEAGGETCHIKFAAVAPRVDARTLFRRLLGACTDYARRAGATSLRAGVSAARQEAYEDMLAAGFRITLTGIAMHRPNEPGFSRPGAFVIDDWR